MGSREAFNTQRHHQQHPLLFRIYFKYNIKNFYPFPLCVVRVLSPPPGTRASTVHYVTVHHCTVHYRPVRVRATRVHCAVNVSSHAHPQAHRLDGILFPPTLASFSFSFSTPFAQWIIKGRGGAFDTRRHHHQQQQHPSTPSGRGTRGPWRCWSTVPSSPVVHRKLRRG